MRALRAPSRGSPARTSTNERLGSRTAHGNGTAFSAVAPSERPVLPSIDPIFGSGIPPGPNGHPTFHSLIRFHPVLPSSSANLHCLILCRPFATYRRATPSAAFTICRCIATVLVRSVAQCVGVTPAQQSGIFLLGGRPRLIHSKAQRVYSSRS